jgi:hypothetical protein
MPTKREIVDRPRRTSITPEVLSLFIELEHIPPRQRCREEFKLRQRQLMRLLDLVPQFWTMNSVLDRHGPSGPEGGLCRQHHAECRAVRERLLEATRPQ